MGEAATCSPLRMNSGAFAVGDARSPKALTGAELDGLPDAKRSRCSMESAGSQRSLSIASPAINTDAAGSSANADGDDKREQQAAAACTRATAAAKRGVGDLDAVARMQRRAEARDRLDDAARGVRPQIGAAAPASTQSSAKSGSSTDAVSGAATADGASATCTRHTDATLPGGVSPLDISASAVRTQDDGAAPRDGVSSFDASPASVPDAPAAPSGDPPAGVVRVADVCNKELLDQVSVDASSLLGYTEQGEKSWTPPKLRSTIQGTCATSTRCSMSLLAHRAFATGP